MAGSDHATASLEGSSYGFHILKVAFVLILMAQIHPNSPAFAANLDVYFDFITHLAGVRVRTEKELLSIIGAHWRKPLSLIVYSSKTTTLRNVTIIPQGSEQARATLGCAVKLCDFNQAHERVWHILDVSDDSPAMHAGLVSNTDYIVASREGDLYEKQDFGALVGLYEGKQLSIWVYSSVLDTVREVFIVPNSKWGGDGMLGCDIGYGQLHRIALSRPQNAAAPSASSSPAAASTVSFQKHPSYLNPGHSEHDHSHSDGHSHDHDHAEHSHSGPGAGHSELSHSDPSCGHDHGDPHSSHSHTEPSRHGTESPEITMDDIPELIAAVETKDTNGKVRFEKYTSPLSKASHPEASTEAGHGEHSHIPAGPGSSHAHAGHPPKGHASDLHSHDGVNFHSSH
ncbi:Golgi reassembly-stacking protein 2 [Kappamyces sp. JEL0829]|nr:Golgi reassembly-stacking protein 2 [Kappamyces sp. JEL0829]